MCKFINFIKGILSFFLVLSMTTVKCSRKYDINEEAKSLYHTDVKTILKMFRRTPEYLRILDDKRQALDESLRDAKMHLNSVYSKKLKERVRDMFDLKDTTALASTDEKSRTTPTEETSPSASEHNFRYQVRRQNEPEPEKGVKALDEYTMKVSSGALTQAERLHAKNLGFEFTGNIIHALIKTLGNDNAAGENRSTTTSRQPPGKNDTTKYYTTTTTTTTTEHGHEVTTITESLQSDLDEILSTYKDVAANVSDSVSATGSPAPAHL